MTWEFAYVALLIVGLVLASVTGLLRDLRSLGRRYLVVPHPDQHSPFLGLIGRRLSVGLVLGGLVGFVAGARWTSDPRTTALLAAGTGLVGILGAAVVLRRPCLDRVHGERATVVRDIPPGGYGQIRIERNGVVVVIAAQSADPVPIPAGAEVDVVECTRSVLTVRAHATA